MLPKLFRFLLSCVAALLLPALVWAATTVGTGITTDSLTVDTDTFYVDAENNRVGIGTTTPASKLEIAGTAEMTGFKLTTSPTNNYVLTSDAAGMGTWQAAAFSYFADSTEADQGAAGSGRSVKDLVDLIGSNNATITFTHHSGANTDYIFSTDETIPANITLKFQNGARAVIASDKYLLINGPFEAGLYQVFSGSGLVSFYSGTITKVYPQWWGAQGDGVTDDSAAIIKAVRSAINRGSSYPNAGVHFPTGIYIIKSNGVLNDIDVIQKEGIHFSGDGMHASELRLSTSGSDLWLYDNGTTPRMSRCTFTDLRFSGGSQPIVYSDLSDNAKGFHLYSTYAIGSREQGFKFTRCAFSNLHTAFSTSGNNTASEIHFHDCKFSHIKDVIYSINNSQSMNHEFYGCDMESNFGDLFRLGTEGGGSIKVFGGSIIHDAGSGLDEYLLDVAIDNGTGFNNGGVLFNGVRFELKGNNTKCVNASGTGVFSVGFNDCTFWSTATAIKTDWVNINHSKTVNFNSCVFTWADSAFYEEYTLSSAGQYGQPGHIKWTNCLTHPDLSEHISFTSGYGRATATDCSGANYGAFTTEPYVVANDFDLFGVSGSELIGGNNNNDIRLKTVSIMSVAHFPYNNTNERTVKLPKNALIKNIKVQKNAQGDSGSDYCLHVGNDDKSTVYVSSIPLDFQYAHQIDYERGSTSIAQLTTRTDDDTGVFTFQGGNHSISEGDTVNLNWVIGGVAGTRVNMTVTSIAMAVQGSITISLNGGLGSNLPAVNSDCHLVSNTRLIDVGSTDNERTVRMWSSNGDKSTAGGNELQTGGYAIIEYY